VNYNIPVFYYLQSENIAFINYLLQIKVGNFSLVLRVRFLSKTAVTFRRLHFEYSPEAYNYIYFPMLCCGNANRLYRLKNGNDEIIHHTVNSLTNTGEEDGTS